MRGKSAVSEAQLRGLADFRATLRGFLHFSEAAAACVGLTSQQHQLMLQIAGAPEDVVITVGYLAERLALRHNSAVELCNRCEAAGWIARYRFAENRRLVTLRLTSAGKELLDELSIDHFRELKQLAPKLIRVLNVISKQQETS
jgi:DNA-binding MarR family transcriptional regulator